MTTTFERPGLTVDALVLAGSGEDMQVLVIERGKPPGMGLWALPGGFVDKFESPRAAVVRELREETGLMLPAAAARPLALRSREGRDPRGWTVSQPFLFWLPATAAVTGGDDARLATWVALRELGPLAFDHGAILCEGLGRFWPAMPDGDQSYAGVTKGFGVPANFPSAPIFFGGSFNPWHQGHAAAVEACPERGRVIVVPDYNPFKAAPTEACAFARYRAIRAAAAPLGVGVYPGFCGIEDKNPTCYWLRRMTHPPSLLLGADSFMALQTWAASAELLALLHEIFVAQRQVPEKTLDAQRKLLLAQAPGVVIHLLGAHAFEGVSSTAIRTKTT